MGRSPRRDLDSLSGWSGVGVRPETLPADRLPADQYRNLQEAVGRHVGGARSMNIAGPIARKRPVGEDAKTIT
jgi:hypothetical protein